VEHGVKVAEFKSWLNRTGGSPAETVQRDNLVGKIRGRDDAILREWK
jgi:hypothetical protein